MNGSMNGSINEIALTLHMLSDWHIGAGVGTPPMIDRRVVRDNGHDNKGLPVIPEGTIKGIWRDAAETLIAGTAHHQAWSCWLDWLFGSRISVGSAPHNSGAPPVTGRLPVQGHAYFSAARLPDALVQGLRESPQWAEALFLLRRHTRLDKHGQVMPETLRTIEFVRGELTLEARARLPEAECLTFANQDSESAHKAMQTKAMQAMRALLIGSALNIERIGAHRRRGAGRCAVAVHGVDSAELDRLFDVLEQSPPELPSRRSAYLPLAGFSEPHPAQHPHAQHPHKDAQPGAAFDITLELRQPISCAARQLGNLQTCLDYLPGRALAKPLLSALYKLAPDYPWLREFSDGGLVIAHAYPEIKGVRGVPAPFSLYYDKAQGAQGGELYNLMWQSAEAVQAALQAALQTGRPDNPPQLKVLGGGYLSPELSPESPSQPPQGRSGLQLQRHAVPKILVQRNAVEHQSQRPTSAVGGIYSREAIAAGQTYRSVLRLSGDAYSVLKNSEKAQNGSEAAQKSLQEAVQQAFTSTRIGGGAPGCGEVHMRAALPRRYPEPSPCADGKRLLVYCAADVMLDAQALSLQPLEDVLLEAINQVLGEKAALRRTDNLIDMALRTRLDGGWSPRWGLPRETAIVLAAGSCLVLERARPFAARELSALQQRGLGKRRGEGYGELMCNPPFLMAGNSGADYV